MVDFIRIVRGLLRSPWFYFYWGISAAGIIISHMNQGIKGSPWLGGASILCTIAGIVIFYHQLRLSREGSGMPGRPSEFCLFLSIYAFRIRLLILFAPVIFLFLRSGAFNTITTYYITIITMHGTEKLAQVAELGKAIWPWLLALFVFFILDQAGRGFVVAQGSARRSFRSCFSALWVLLLPMTLYMGAELLLIGIDSWDLTRDPLTTGREWAGPLTRIVISGPKFLLEIGATVYMAAHLLRKAPSLFKNP